MIDELRGRLAKVPGFHLSEQAFGDRIAEVLPPGWLREHALSNGMRIDFFEPVSGVGLEVKVDGSRGAVLRQVSKYADCGEVAAVVLVTTKPNHWMPSELCGKPIHLVKMWGR